MITIRRADDRGHADLGWLDSRHTFSFGRYYDQRHMGFGQLRVINDDRVAPGRGFGAHSHKDMEILTYVLDGALAHKDSLGTGSVINPGDVQVMSAGTGIEHSEFNASQTEQVHFLQIWIFPEMRGLEPRYEQKTFSDIDKRGVLKLVGSHDGRNGSVIIHSPVALYAAVLSATDQVTHAFTEGRSGWVHVATGEIEVDGHMLGAGDALAIEHERSLLIKGHATRSELLVFDMSTG